MRMKNLPHPGEIVREDVIAALELNLTRAAAILGVRQAPLSDLCNGKAALTTDMALRLEKTFGVSMDLLLRLQAVYDAAQARADEVEVHRFVPA